MIFNMRKIFLIIILLCAGSLYSFNRTVPLYFGTDGLSRSSLNISDSSGAESFYFNPAIGDKVKLLDFSYLVSQSKIGSLNYKYFNGNIGVQLGLNYYEAYQNKLKYDNNLYTIASSIDIAGLYSGVSVIYHTISQGDNSGDGIELSVGLKKSGMLSGKRLDIGLSYKKETVINWKNDYNEIKKIPAQILLGTTLIGDGMDFSATVQYLFPVFANQNSNFSIPIYDEEMRVSVSAGFDMKLLLKFKLNLGYKQIFDNQISGVSKKFLGIGAVIPVGKFKIKLGYNSNAILENSEEDISVFSAGIVIGGITGK